MHCHLHPWVNAALIVLLSDFISLVSGSARPGRNEIGPRKRLAFRRHSRESGQRIERRDDSAAEVFDFRERVNLTADVRRVVLIPFRQKEIGRSESPSGRTSELRELRDSWRADGVPDAMLAELSMGMSGDFEVAVQEGATIVRVGTAIFGSRE